MNDLTFVPVCFRSLANTACGVLILLCAFATVTFAQSPQAQTLAPATPLNIKFANLQWQKIFPDWTEGSPEFSILHVDSKTGQTQLMIRVPKNFHVPRHWHTANETHTVISGTFIIECDGKREELTPGSFNYMPSKMVHEAWSKPNEETVLFITTDGAWDVNWPDGPPKQPDKR